jgi:hypothetical protein
MHGHVFFVILTRRRNGMNIVGSSLQVAAGVLASVLLLQTHASAVPQIPARTADSLEGTTIRDPGYIKAILSATASFWQDRLDAKSNLTYKIQRKAYTAGPFEVLVDIEAGKVTSVMEFPSAKVLYSSGQSGATLWGAPLPQAVMIPEITRAVVATMESKPEGSYGLRGEIVWPLKLSISTDPDLAIADDEVEYGITVYEPTVP